MNAAGLEQDFAARHPSSFAKVTSTLSIGDSITVLSSLRPEHTLAVLNFLPASHLLAIARSIITPQVLAATSFEKSLPVLLRLPRELMIQLVRELSDTRLRSKYQQALRQSTGTVATLVKPATMVCDSETSISDLTKLIRHATEEPAVLITGSDGLYRGVLSIWQCIDRFDKSAAHAMQYIAPLQVDTLLNNSRRHPLWHHRLWFPVIDHERHAIGILWRHDIEQTHDDVSPTELSSTNFISTVVTSLNKVTVTLAKEAAR